MESAEVTARIMKHLCDIGGVSIGFDNPLGIHVFNNDRFGFYVHLNCSDTFEAACGDNEVLYTEEHLNLFLECSRIFVKQYTGKDIEDWERTFFPTEEQDDEYARWLPILYCARVRKQHPLYGYIPNVPEWLVPHFEKINN